MSFRECIMVRLFTRICFDCVGQSLYFILLCYHIMNNTSERDAMSLWMRAQAPPHRAEYGCLRSFVSALRSNSHQTFFCIAVQLCYAWQIERSLFWHASSLFAYDVKLLDQFLKWKFGVGSSELKAFCIGTKFSQEVFPCVMPNSPLVMRTINSHP